MQEKDSINRRGFLGAAGTAFTTSLFTGNVKGANDRIRAGFIGVGDMGSGNLEYAMKQKGLEVVALCDVYQPNLDDAMATARKGGFQPKAVHDFREILADKSIDVVNVSTPDHWHAYITVEACKSGKDVYVEKPISRTLEEGKIMVEAARKYNRVVQAGTMQRSAPHFQKACEIVRSGQIGDVKFCRTFTYGNGKRTGIGNPPDAPPPAGLDWDLWLGPAPQRPFNENRCGSTLKNTTSSFRFFWDYAGGMMTDWGIHVLDIVHMALGEQIPKSVTSMGGRWWYQDDAETPDTLQVTYEYPGFLALYENRSSNENHIFDQGYGTAFHGSEATLFVNREFYRLIPEKKGGEVVEVKRSGRGNLEHWANFLDCVKTRQKPASDVEVCYKSTAACLLGNAAYRTGLRLDWDEENQTVKQEAARKYLQFDYRAPWKLTA